MPRSSFRRASIHRHIQLAIAMAALFSTLTSQSYQASRLFLLPRVNAFVTKQTPSFSTGRVSIHRNVHSVSSHNKIIQPSKGWLSSLAMVLKDPASESLSQQQPSSQSHRKIHMTQRQNEASGRNAVNVEPLVICGPSGVGKGTIIEGLMKRFQDNSQQNPFGFSVSHTTRQPRPGEEHGTHYHFTDMQDMQQQIEDGKFVEHAHVHGNLYGTSKQAIADLQDQNKITILDIDMQGVMAVKESKIPAKYIFIAPPSMEELEGRLRGRATETEEAIRRRLGNAAKELAYGEEAGNFDQVIVNNDIDGAVQNLVNILEEWYPQLRSEEDE